MRDDTDGQLIDLSTIRLERALRRLEDQNCSGAVEDLRAALQHMRRSGASVLEVEHLSAMIEAVEQQAS